MHTGEKFSMAGWRLEWVSPDLGLMVASDWPQVLVPGFLR